MEPKDFHQLIDSSLKNMDLGFYFDALPNLEKILNNEQTETYIFNNLFEFSKIEIDILQHFENIIYRKRLISFFLFLNESKNKLKYYKSFLLYKELVKELIKSNWGLNYQINDIQKYLIHQNFIYLKI